jgi:hypothetical protein
LILKSLPKEKASDMTRANRLFTFLSFLPIVKFSKRPSLTIVKKGDISIQTILIATFEDLQNTISLMEYSDGVRPYILEWYYNVLIKTFEDKQEPDSKLNSKGEELKEDRIALTSQDLIKKHFEVHNETLNTKRLLESYIYPLLNQGYIDKIDSQIDRRAKIYYPIITTKKYINLFENEKSNNLSQQKEKIIVNSTIFPSKEHIISKIEPIIKYYSESGFIVNIKNHNDTEISIDELVNQYFGNNRDYFEIDVQDEEEDENEQGTDVNNIVGNEEEDETGKNLDEEENKENSNSSSTNHNNDANTFIIANNNNNNNNHNVDDDVSDPKNTIDSSASRTTNLVVEIKKNNFLKDGISEEYLQNGQNIEQLHEKQGNDVNSTTNRIQQSNKLFETAKTNKIIYSNSDIDSRVKNDNGDEIKKQEDATISNDNKLLNKPLILCHYCNFKSNNENELLTHSVNFHPGKPARPDPEMLKLLQQQEQQKPKEDVDQVF